MKEVRLIVLSPDEIVLPERELRARLQMPGDTLSDEVGRAIESVRRRIECKCAYIETAFSVDKDAVVFPFATVESRSLVKFLRGCGSCILTAVTLGMGVERFLASIPDENAAEKMIADAAADAFIEGACDKTQEMLAREFGEITERFSPGYGDLSLDFQPVLLRELNASRLLGVTLTESLMMMPRKTVSAIIGVKKQ